jgi:hypothetical protein
VAVRWIPTDQNWADISTYLLSHWQPKISTSSGSRCADMSHGRCPTERRRPLAGATQFEFTTIEFTHWQSDTTQADDLLMAKVAQELTRRHRRRRSCFSALDTAYLIEGRSRRRSCKHRSRVPAAMRYSAIGTARSGVMMESPQGGAHAIVNRRHVC